MNKPKLFAYILPIAVIGLITAITLNTNAKKPEYHKDSGLVFGTSYNITYESDQNLKADIENVLEEVNQTLSPFEPNSLISKVNNNEKAKLSESFVSVFNLAMEISKNTDGAFDITVAPLVNAWGFGFKNGSIPSDKQVDSIRAFVGYEKVALKNGIIEKADPRTMLDCSAIAKGYGVDCVANFLRNKGIENFMVEIGGEIVASGKNSRGTNWNIGVTQPTEDSLGTDNKLQTILSISNMAMATSGNYRNFYYKDGKKYAHTIDPKTGHPVQHSILSATVLAPTCATADAYATAFMVSGIEKTKAILERNSSLAAYLIYTDKKGNYKVWHSPAFNNYIKQ